MNKCLCFLVMAIILGTRLLAQQNDVVVLRSGIGFVPQYALSGGFRFDIDQRLSKTSNQWLSISPQVFMASGNRINHSFKSLVGMGMDIKHKIYLNPAKLKPQGYYFQYGGMFQYFSITDTRNYLESYFENEVEYYGLVYGEITTKLYKFGGNFHLGYQWLIGDKMYFDVYTGAGIRISHNNRNTGFDTWFNNSWIDYGYSGTLLDGGFRVGIFF